MRKSTKNILKYIAIGAFGLLAVGLIAVCIGSAVNGVTFGEQITQWFGSGGAVETAIEEVTQTPGA